MRRAALSANGSLMMMVISADCERPEEQKSEPIFFNGRRGPITTAQHLVQLYPLAAQRRKRLMYGDRNTWGPRDSASLSGWIICDRGGGRDAAVA